MTISEMFTKDLFVVDETPLIAAVEALASQGGVEERGAFYTRPEVVHFMLNLAGYTDDKPLYEMRVLEPSCGGGSFLYPIVERLLNSWERGHDRKPLYSDLSSAVRAVELHSKTYDETRYGVSQLLLGRGVSKDDTDALVSAWMRQGDFLLSDFGSTFDLVVGNPPYVRQELIPQVLLAEYRKRYTTLYDRADLYIPFIEKSLRLLAKDGSVTFICADRWMKNRYGGPLRDMISKEFNLRMYIDMYDTPAFFTEVVAYPAITVIAKEKASHTRVMHRPSIDSVTLSALAEALAAPDVLPGIKELTGVVAGSEPWLLESSDQMAIIRKLEAKFPLLEEAGCKVGIGVATGADKAFIGQYDSLDVEQDRKLPLVTTRDIGSGEVVWSGLGVINPYRDEGGLVDLQEYPKLRKYLEDRREVIEKRHCAQKSPAHWYKTIDRITPSLADKPKLLIPDIKGKAHIVYEGGGLYPHHNLYYVTSGCWDLHALQAVMLSEVTRLFIATYSTKMRGGFLRFQAQYLRRIRLPHWDAVPVAVKQRLTVAGRGRNLELCNLAVFDMYGLTEEQRAVLGGMN